MVDVNRITTPANTRWKLIDRSTDAANHAIQWQFTVGDRVKIRLVNEMDSDHPMHHPFHIHGAGRFLVLARDGEPEPNLVWSDTVLVRTGEVVDILLDVTNPGHWMAHCHIAEHHESGMMFSFDVAAAGSVGMTEHRDVVVVGGGQAGLAIGYFLARQGRRFTILEAAGEPAAAWRERWDSLRLFTPVRYDSLPGRPFPGDPDSYPTATRSSPTWRTTRATSSCRCELDSRVLAVRGADGALRGRAGRPSPTRPTRSSIATGPFRSRSRRRSPPAWRRTSPSCTAPSTADPISCPTGRWSSSAAATPATRSPRSSARSREVHWPIGARQTPLPQRILGRDLFRYLERLGLMAKTVDSRLGAAAEGSRDADRLKSRAARASTASACARGSPAPTATALTFADGSGSSRAR